MTARTRKPRTLAERPEGDLSGLRPESIASARVNGGLGETVAAVGWRIQTANDVETMRQQARAVACPVRGCEAISSEWRSAEAVLIECSGKHVSEPWEYGVHAARARLAGLPPHPTAAERAAGARVVCEEVPCPRCGECADEERCDPMFAERDGTCLGTGKLKRWRWVLPAAETKRKGRGPKR